MPIVSFGVNTFRQSASYVPCEKDELTRPLRGHPFSTRKGGARQHALRFPQMCLASVVQGNIHHPIRLRHLPYLGKVFYLAAFGRRDYISCPFSLLRIQLPRGEACPRDF